MALSDEDLEKIGKVVEDVLDRHFIPFLAELRTKRQAMREEYLTMLRSFHLDDEQALVHGNAPEP